jgi:hypothetical protein
MSRTPVRAYTRGADLNDPSSKRDAVLNSIGITQDQLDRSTPKEVTPKDVIGHTPQNHADISEAFAKGATKGKTNNILIIGDTIYSYGTHFPIARKVGHIAFFTTKGYSNTTSKHKSRVYSALANEGYLIIETEDPTTTDYKKVYQELAARQLMLDTKRIRARTDESKGSYTSQITALSNQISYLKQTFPEATK